MINEIYRFMILYVKNSLHSGIGSYNSDVKILTPSHSTRLSARDAKALYLDGSTVVLLTLSD